MIERKAVERWGADDVEGKRIDGCGLTGLLPAFGITLVREERKEHCRQNHRTGCYGYPCVARERGEEFQTFVFPHD